MKVPWSKAKEAEKAVTSSDSSGNHEDSPATARTGPDASPGTVDDEKGAGNDSDLITSSLQNQPESEPAAAAFASAADPKNIVETENHEELTRTTTASTDPGRPGEDDETKYATGLPLHLLTVGLVLSTFVVALDNTIIATAIPRITTVFNSLDDVGWYGSSYLLTTTSLQPSFGKVYTYFNVKWTYMFALIIFEFGSVLCGAAVNSTMLIVGRAIAGCGAAALFSGGVSDLLPPTQDSENELIADLCSYIDDHHRLFRSLAKETSVYRSSLLHVRHCLRRRTTARRGVD